ncbi:MAG TPA: hypothetical protein VJB92_03865 [Candidatus Paceibacterota bacterium]
MPDNNRANLIWANFFLLLIIFSAAIFSSRPALGVSGGQSIFSLVQERIKSNKEKNLLPTSESFFRSGLVYDYKLGASQKYLSLSSVNGYLPQTRLLIENQGSLTANLRREPPFKDKVSIYLRDELGRIAAFSEAPQLKAEVEPGIYFLFVAPENSQIQSIELTFELEPGGTSSSYPKTLKRLNINLSGESLKALKDLTEKAASEEYRYYPPANRVQGEIESGASVKTLAGIGLSGRTPEHFKFPPSLDVKIESGPLFLGMKHFKLYRIETKSGLYDFIHHEALFDLGLLSAREDLVRVFLNGDDQGVYYLEETYGGAYLENLFILDGNILGYDADAFFINYPRGMQFKLQQYYSKAGLPSKLSTAVTNLEYELSSQKFIERVDKEDFSKLLAYCAVFACAHGLGIDDLRFYENPRTSVFRPIVRDLNPGEAIDSNNAFDALKAFLSHGSFWLTHRPASGYPLLALRDSKFSKNAPIVSTDESIAFWDVHPAAVAFLSNPENWERFWHWLRAFSSSDFWEQALNRRIVNLAVISELKNHDLIGGQIQDAQGGKILSLRESVRALTASPEIWIGENEDNFELVNLNPYPIFFSLAKDTQVFLAGSYTLPLVRSGGFSSQSGVVNIELEQALNKVLSADVPTVLKSAVEFPKNAARPNLEATLEEQGFSVLKGELRFDSEKEGPGYEKAFQALLTPIFESQENNEAVLGYILRNRGADEDLNQIVLRSDGRKVKPFLAKKIESGDQDYDLNQLNVVNRIFESEEKIYLIAFKLKLNGSPQKYRIEASPDVQIYDAEFNLLPAYRDEMFIAPSSEVRKYFNLNEDRKILTLKVPNTTIEESVRLPDNFALRLKAGEQMVLAPRICLELKGGLQIEGTKDKPVRVSSSDKNGGIVFVNKESAEVNIKNAKFLNLGYAPTMPCFGKELLGGITFYNSRISMNGVFVTGSNSEDAINFVDSEAIIDGATVENSAGDAFDFDFGVAKISNSEFRNNKNDNIDLSGTYFEGLNLTLISAGDKGISFGERSRAKLFGVKFEKNDMGLALKDESVADLQKCEFIGNRIGIANYIKKPQYVSGIINAPNCFFSANGESVSDLGYFQE